MSVAALVISTLALIGSSAFSYLSWRLNKRTYAEKAPKIVCTIGWSARGVRLFEPITAPHRAEQGAIGLKVRNDGDRPIDVTDVTCYVAGAGQWGQTMHGAWPAGPDLPHQIATGEALWDLPLSQIAHLHNYRQHGEDTPCDVGFRLTLSSGESRDVGPVRVLFPPAVLGPADAARSAGAAHLTLELAVLGGLATTGVAAGQAPLSGPTAGEQDRAHHEQQRGAQQRQDRDQERAGPEQQQRRSGVRAAHCSSGHGASVARMAGESAGQGAASLPGGPFRRTHASPGRIAAPRQDKTQHTFPQCPHGAPE